MNDQKGRFILYLDKLRKGVFFFLAILVLVSLFWVFLFESNIVVFYGLFLQIIGLGMTFWNISNKVEINTGNGLFKYIFGYIRSLRKIPEKAQISGTIISTSTANMNITGHNVLVTTGPPKTVEELHELLNKKIDFLEENFKKINERMEKKVEDSKRELKNEILNAQTTINRLQELNTKITYEVVFKELFIFICISGGLTLTVLPSIKF